jgi:hypothetical protein
MKKNLVIVPTRCRNANHLEFAQEFFKNSQISDLMFGLDEDDQHHYQRVPGARYHCHPRSEKRMNGTLNLLARKYVSQYEYVTMLGDDSRIRTPQWDTIMYEKIKNIPLCIAYGNDLLQGELLSTHVVMDSRIIRTLGSMTPPVLFHYYVDNFWLELGKELGTLTYFPDVILEHMHHATNKSKYDDLYHETGTGPAQNDKSAWIDYLKTQFPLDVAKLKFIQ